MVFRFIGCIDSNGILSWLHILYIWHHNSLFIIVCQFFNMTCLIYHMNTCIDYFLGCIFYTHYIFYIIFQWITNQNWWFLYFCQWVLFPNLFDGIDGNIAQSFDVIILYGKLAKFIVTILIRFVTMILLRNIKIFQTCDLSILVTV